MKRAILPLLLASCAPQHAPQVAPPASLTSHAEPATDAPGVLAGAAQARSDAEHYVAWDQAKAGNIDRLTVLTGALNDAVSVMKAHEVRGVYRAGDVVAVRSALAELRRFLAVKGD